MAEASDLKGDPALQCLVLLLRFHGLAVDPEQMRHRFGGAEIGIGEILRCARDFKLKARLVTADWAKLRKLNLPAIAECRDGGFFILARVTDDTALVQVGGRPQIIGRNQFEALVSGRYILMTRRADLGALVRRFDISWFMQAMHKYRGLLTEVVVASFFLQIFALVTPLFFQVVIDKVLVHRGLTTLDVLVIGLLTLSAFESVLTGLRTYVFAHTTNRIDVELGARLFRHLVALPVAYFEARRAGDSVARVRELENIRNFLTSSSLTLVIDLVFTVIFLAVMFYYSALLTWIVVVSLPLCHRVGRRDALVSHEACGKVRSWCRKPGISG
jgi:ATP-binding cassette, subfamily B, bacterial HlyB/CyaB